MWVRPSWPACKRLCGAVSPASRRASFFPALFAARTHHIASAMASDQASPDSALSQKLGELRARIARMPTVTCYHHPCIDGVFAALASYMHHSQRQQQEQRHESTADTHSRHRLFPLSVYKPAHVAALELQGDECVFFLDYVGPKDFVQQVAGHAAQVIVLDHHKTAAEQLADTSQHPPNLHVELDMQRSGATIALDWFVPAGLNDQLRRAYRMVEDGDLWRWKVPGSREFHAGMRALNMEYDCRANPNVFDQLLALDVDSVVQKGEAVLEEQDRLVAACAARAFNVQLGGTQGIAKGWGRCLGVVVDAEQARVRSQLGNVLAARSEEAGLAPVAVVAYREPEMDSTRIKVSLRSLRNWDTTTITQSFGGGGHCNASACILPVDNFEAWRTAEVPRDDTTKFGA